MFPNLIIEMKRKKCSQKGLAQYIGVDEKTIGKKMNEHVEFTLAEMERIKEAFPGCTLDYLFTRYQ